MQRFMTRLISALGDTLACAFVRLGNAPSIGWLSDDTLGWDFVFLYRDDAVPAPATMPGDSDGSMAA